MFWTKDAFSWIIIFLKSFDCLRTSKIIGECDKSDKSDKSFYWPAGGSKIAHYNVSWTEQHLASFFPLSLFISEKKSP